MLIRSLGAVIFLLVYTGLVVGQTTKLFINNNELIHVITQIEQETDLTFNYDPVLLAEYSFSGTLNLDKRQLFLSNLFHLTPFEFELSGNNVLVSLPPKQVYSICGTVVDNLTRTPLSFANVFADDQIHGVQTKEDGTFELTFLAHKHQKISISYVGYRPQSFTLQRWPQKSCPTIHLNVDGNLFGDIIVVKDYILDGITEGEAYGSVNLNYDQIANWQANVEQDLFKTIQLIPGINSVDESATNLSIRGSSADQNLLIWEGAKLYEPGHLFGMISAVNPFVIENMKVFKGVFEPKYDNVVGGVIDMSLSDEITETFRGGVGTTFTEAHAYLDIPIIDQQLSLLVSGRNTINGVFRSPTLESYSAKVFQETKVLDQEDDLETEQILNFYDWNAKVLFQPFEKLLFKASFFNSGDKFNYDTGFFEEELNSNDRVNSSSRATSLSLAVDLNKIWKTQVSFTNSNYENDYEFTISDPEEAIDVFRNKVFNDIRDKSFTLSNIIKLPNNGSIDFGYEFNSKEVNFNIEETSVFEWNYEEFNAVAGSFHNLYTSLFYQKGGFQINGGFRAINYTEIAKWSLSPRFNVQQVLNSNLKLKFSAGILHQYISQLKEFGDNQLGINNQIWVLNRIEEDGNATQRADKFSAGLLFKKAGLLLDIEGYYHKINGLHTFSPLFGNNPEGADFSIGNSTTKGLDVLLKKRWNRYSIWFNYTLSQTLFGFPDIDQEQFAGTHDQRHNFSIINNWKLKNWNISISYQFKSGLPFSQFDDILPFEEEDEVYYEIEYESLNGVRLNNYSRLDLGVSYKHFFDKSGLKLETAFSIINLLDRDNLFNRNYFLGELDESDEEPELFVVDKLMLGFTPQLLFRINW